MKKVWQIVSGGIKLVKDFVAGLGLTAQATVQGSIEAVGGRKVWVGLLTMVYVPVCFAVLKMPTELIIASLVPITGFVAVEGVRDVVETKK